MRSQSAMPATAPVGLADKLAALADPRSPRGRRHSLASVLLCALCAMLAGARHLRAIGQWADAAPQHTLPRPGSAHRPVPGNHPPRPARPGP
ncbi:transposase family protein [Nocardiopsis sp. EMB25]|uniref:transposase family protein n=1 Tax=Nocardiopsis sp. EMB25 TaxID=2835867 RepID=UPI002283A255|nr:transposase family protein [Nocardiopsis sp. EMB25]MCY9785215.1 transposase family protein [Nocardiopsis sp. EMB25]